MSANPFMLPKPYTPEWTKHQQLLIEFARDAITEESRALMYEPEYLDTALLEFFTNMELHTVARLNGRPRPEYVRIGT